VRFRFRLARVQHVRELEERVARAALSEGERAARAAEEALAVQRNVVEEARATVSGATAGPVLPRSAEVERRAVDGLLRGLTRHKERVLTARGQASRLAEAWRSREQDRRGLEKLEQRHRERQRAEETRRDAQGMDEVARERLRRAHLSHRAPAVDEGGPGPRSPSR
jgi:flagellar export protein FliJ